MAGNLFHRGHYNILAAQIWRQLEKYPEVGINRLTVENHEHRIIRGVIIDIALSLAKRLKQDNPAFNAVKFLDACSPDPDLYPLSELWEG